MAGPETESTASFDPERYWSDRLEQRFSLGGVGWLGLGEPYNRWMYAVRRRVFRRVIRDRLDLPRARVLDVGSGTGFYVSLWRELGAGAVTGSDLTASRSKGCAAASRTFGSSRSTSRRRSFRSTVPTTRSRPWTSSTTSSTTAASRRRYTTSRVCWHPADGSSSPRTCCTGSRSVRHTRRAEASKR